MTSETPTALQQLIESFPRLFRGDEPQCSSHLLPGWKELVFGLCHNLDTLLADADAAAFEITQIKEKWGSLRFYWSFEDQKNLNIDFATEEGVIRIKHPPDAATDIFEEIEMLVNAAELASRTMCSACGAPGELRVLVDDKKLCPTGYYTIGKDPAPKGAYGYVACRCTEHAHRDSWGEAK